MPPRLMRYAASGSRSAAAGSATAARCTTPAGATSATSRASHAASHTSPAWNVSGRSLDPRRLRRMSGQPMDLVSVLDEGARDHGSGESRHARHQDPHRLTPLRRRSRSARTIISTSARESHAGRPAEHAARLRGVPDQVIDLGRAEQRGVLAHVTARVEAHDPERDLDEVAHRVRLAGRHHVVVRDWLLEHAPHRLDVVAGEAPVAAGVEVADDELGRLAERDARDALRHLPGHELATAARALVVEEDARAGEQAVALAVVDRDVVAVDLRDAVRAAGMKRRRLALRRLRACPNISLELAW